MYLILLKFVELAKYLIKQGAEVNFTTYDGISPLTLAVKADNYPGVKLLV